MASIQYLLFASAIVLMMMVHQGENCAMNDLDYEGEKSVKSRKRVQNQADDNQFDASSDKFGCYATTPSRLSSNQCGI